MGWGELSLGDISSVLAIKLSVRVLCLLFDDWEIFLSYLVSLVGSGGSNLALLTRGKLSQIAVVVTLPKWVNLLAAVPR